MNLFAWSAMQTLFPGGMAYDSLRTQSKVIEKKKCWFIVTFIILDFTLRYF